MTLRNLSGLALLGILFLTRVAPAEKLTYLDLVRKMTDVRQLAVLPAPGEKGAMFSSYDRASRYDAAADKYIQWGANDDGGQMYVRKEGSGFVLAEMQGPGCIWRIWSATANQGHVKIYLDGAEQPVIDLPFAHYFDGKHAPFNYPALSYLNEARGYNLYYPIPYQKSCKVVAEEKWGRYFQFTYQSFPAGTELPTFQNPPSADWIAAIAQVNDFFATKLGQNTPPSIYEAVNPSPKSIFRGACSVEPGETVNFEKIAGPAAIVKLQIRLEPFADREEEMTALRELVLKITFDNLDVPSVLCPLGDFFGTAPGQNFYKSLLMGMTEEGSYSFWYMPFGQNALIEIQNEGKVKRMINCTYRVEKLSQPMEKLGYFHAKWHRDLAPVRADRRPDWTMLQTQGRGRFCGVMLHVWSPRGSWWGEGDEKFFVDGEKFPSTFGTGSEDYFGYAWCDPHLFTRAYHGQTMTQNNKGHQSVFRVHVADNVPFQQSFEGVIEKYQDNKFPTLYACTAYWYQAGGSDAIQPTPRPERDGYYVPYELKEAGYKFETPKRGSVQTQDLRNFGDGKWKDNNQLWWTGGQPGDKLVIELPVKETGRYQLTARLTKARDYAIVRLALDGQPLGAAIDLYDPQVIPTGPISLGVHDLAAGTHQLAVEINGANPNADKKYMFGLDEIELKKSNAEQ